MATVETGEVRKTETIVMAVTPVCGATGPTGHVRGDLMALALALGDGVIRGCVLQFFLCPSRR